MLQIFRAKAVADPLQAGPRSRMSESGSGCSWRTDRFGREGPATDSREIPWPGLFFWISMTIHDEVAQRMNDRTIVSCLSKRCRSRADSPAGGLPRQPVFLAGSRPTRSGRVGGDPGPWLAPNPALGISRPAGRHQIGGPSCGPEVSTPAATTTATTISNAVPRVKRSISGSESEAGDSIR